ncbi:2789_t:CDS:2 [Dentiscutata heterogama]|uniref:2789_t:CDS:1 n=1 Tax=Dentiscutata heterogama TaxID=1316150 RepID=A0ACA9ND67_9GLOM|nr:2789_t:CDS:2 [Dentiscutata heterogama]
MQAEADDWIEEEFGNTNKKDKKQKKKGSDDQKTDVDNFEVKESELKQVEADDWVEEEFEEKRTEIVEADEPAEETAALAAIRAQLEAERKKEYGKNKKNKDELKAKKEELKKSGKYLSQKQRAKQQQDRMRLEQMIKSGYKIEGLDKEGEQAPKRVVYANKKKSPTKQTLDKTETEVLTLKADDKPETSENLKDEREIDTNKDVKENWEKDEDVESNKSTEINDGIRDTWDVSSDEIESGDEKIPKNVTSVENPSATPVKTDTDKKKEPTKVVGTDKKEPAKVVDTDKKKVVDTDKKKAPAKVVDTVSTQKNVSVKDAELEDASESGSDVSETEEDSDEDSGEETDSEKITEHQKQMLKQKTDAAERRKKRHEEALAARSKDNLRSPICCILGHVDTDMYIIWLFSLYMMIHDLISVP